MIKCLITIIEEPEKGYVIDVASDQSKATKQELRVASLLNEAVTALEEYLEQKDEREEMIAPYDKDVMKKIAKLKIQEFESGDSN